MVLQHQSLLLAGQILFVRQVSQLLTHHSLVFFVRSLFVRALRQLFQVVTLGRLLLFCRCRLLLLKHHELLLLLKKGLELLFIELVQEFLAEDWHLNQVAVSHVALEYLVLQVELD